MNIRIMLLAISALGFGVEATMAASRVALRKLPMIIEDNSKPSGMQKLGSLDRYLKDLRRAGHKCDFSTYEYGGNLSCKTNSGKLVYVGISAVPTHGPEFASVTDIRPDGVNSAYLPTSDFAAFLADLVKREPIR